MKQFQTAQQTLDFLRSIAEKEDSKPNENRCVVRRGFDPCDRYIFDFNVCTSRTGWHQYDTNQDAHYFGVWYNVELLATFSYVEGDLILVEAPDKEAFKAELSYMAEFYGNPPPAFVVLDVDKGGVTNCYSEDARPDLSNL